MTDQAQDFSQPRREAVHPELSSWQTDPNGPDLKLGAARWLTWVLLTERPDWTEAEVMAALEDVRDEPVAHTFRAALFVALEPTASPATIATAGPHWDAVRLRAPRKPVARAAEDAPKVHRQKSHRDVDGVLKPSWREDPDFLRARELARPAGAPVFGEDRPV